MKKLFFLSMWALLLGTRPAIAAIACDSTAHSGHTTLCENLVNSVNAGTGWTSLATPSFSSAAGPQLLVLQIYADGGGVPFPFTVAGASLTWTKRVDHAATTNDFGNQIWTAFSATGNLSAVTVTITPHVPQNGGANSSAAMQVVVVNGVPSTEAACIGASSGFIDEVGTSLAAQTAITPGATGSWVFVLAAQSNNTTTLTANASTSAYDFVYTGASDYAGFGRYKVSGTVATTTASSAVTLGSSVTDNFDSVSALEVKASAGVASCPKILGLLGVGC